MPGCRLLIEEVLKARLKKLSKKNRPLYDAMLAKAKEILENPTHYISTAESDERFPAEWNSLIVRASSAGTAGPARAAMCARRHTRAGELGSASFFSIII